MANMLAGPSSTATQSLYACAPATLVQKKSMFGGSRSALSAGAMRSGAAFAAQAAGRVMVTVDGAERTSSQPSAWATTYQRVRPGARAVVSEGAVVAPLWWAAAASRGGPT